MDEITICVEALKSALQTSETYKRYLRARLVVSEDPELYMKLQDFCKKNYELQNKNENINDIYDEVARFEEEYMEFRSNPVVKEYLGAELDVCRLMQRIIYSLVDTIDVNLEQE